MKKITQFLSFNINRSVDRRNVFLSVRYALAFSLVALATGCNNDNDSTEPYVDRYPEVMSAEIASSPTGVNGFPFQSTAIDLTSQGYVEEEYLITGTAQAYREATAFAQDGQWSAEVNPGVEADFTTRAIIRRPVDAADFNGTVVVEWLNVSGGADGAPDWGYAHEELLRGGYIWVGVTSQYVGAQGLVNWESGDNDRYATINHPGDSFSYDIYSQVAKAIASPSDPDNNYPKPLADLEREVKHIVAMGESQSAFRLMTYYNAIQPLAQLFDGFLIHSYGSGAALSESGATSNLGQGVVPAPAGVPATPDIAVPGVAWMRTDLDVPILAINTETDLVFLGAAFSIHQQPDSDTFRLWEFAGLSHADQYLLDVTAADAVKSNIVFALDCGSPSINSGPQQYALRTGINAVHNWLVNNEAPAIGDRLVANIDPNTYAVSLQRDAATGIAVGGIRLPTIEVPVATQTGVRPLYALAANPFCVLFGASDAWNGESDAWDGQPGFDPSPTPEPILSVLYGSEADYVQQITTATDDLISAGHLLASDRDEIIAQAAAFTFP